MILPTLNAERYVVLPSSLELTACKDNDSAALLLSMLTLQTSRLPRARRRDWINIHSDHLQKIIGRGYATVINTLLEDKAIERNDRYSTGQDGRPSFTMSYRLNPRIDIRNTRCHEIKGAWAKRRINQSQRPDPSNLRASGMHYWKLLSRFSFSLKSCMSMSSQTDAMVRFANSNHYAIRCRYGRMHTTLTALPSKMRCFLRIDGDADLTLLDIRNCQPLLLGLLSRTQNCMTYDGVSCSGLDSSDDEWTRRCQDGTLYQSLREAIRAIPGDVLVQFVNLEGRYCTINLKTCSDRTFKRNALVSLFNRQEETERNPVFEIIAKQYPGIAQYVRLSKQDDYRRLACLLQSMESSLMIDALGERLAKLAPDEPVGTIHDAIVCRTAFAQMAEAHLVAVFQEIGLNPSVKKEPLSIAT